MNVIALPVKQLCLPMLSIVLCTLLACSSKRSETKEEQIHFQTPADTSVSDSSQFNSIRNNLSLDQMTTSPSAIVLTGLAQHRLVTIYKSVIKNTTGESYSRNNYESYGYDNDDATSNNEHFMPGIDHLYGYNLLNIAHYDLVTENLNYLFNHPVLIKSLYYPSFIQDSINKIPVTRSYYLVSVYDADTNLDTLINKKDLRRFYYFNATCSEKIQLIPADYSAIRSQYDPQNDVMYIFAKHDMNRNGMADKKEPLHIFWINLKKPEKAKRLY